MPLFKINKSKKASKKPEAKPEEQENTYTNIFEKKEEKPKETGEESAVISGVYAKEEEKTQEKENVLGPLPELEQKIVGAYDPSKRNLKVIRSLFIGLIVVSLLGIGFFYTELNPDFDLLSSVRGPNTTQQLNNSNAQIVTQQTSINQKNYLLLNYYLQELSYIADSYGKARSGQITPQELITLQDQFLITYENALTKWKEPIAVANIPVATFEDELKIALQDELKQLSKETKSQTILAEIDNYRSTHQLIGNQRLATFFSKDTDDIRGDLPRDDTKLYALTEEILDILNNDFSTISTLKQNRIEWAEIVNEIEKVTKSVDTLYNTGFFEELGGVQYASYDFDAGSNEIILSGKAKRDDGTTFSLIANLMDALEKSEMFKSVDNRSFPKTGSEDEGYVSPFRIELTIE
ncbi:hypothetical protein ACFL3C_03325 [Patescibacteria group bacterium]